jgi:hypothetical protein
MSCKIFDRFIDIFLVNQFHAATFYCLFPSLDILILDPQLLVGKIFESKVPTNEVQIAENSIPYVFV